MNEDDRQYWQESAIYWRQRASEYEAQATDNETGGVVASLMAMSCRDLARSHEELLHRCFDKAK